MYVKLMQYSQAWMCFNVWVWISFLDYILSYVYSGLFLCFLMSGNELLPLEGHKSHFIAHSWWLTAADPPTAAVQGFQTLTVF